MHTMHHLSPGLFEYYRGSEPVDRQAVMPTLGIADRLGVVMAEPTDGLGAGHFILDCVTAFYDHIGDVDTDLCEYPDYYTFQATHRPADYRMLDIWPAHKNVRVPADPEAVLRAVIDRAIDVLLVPDGLANAGGVEGASRRSAERNLDACYAYSPDGDPDDPDFSIRLPLDPAEDWYRDTVETTEAPGARFDPALATEAHLTQRFRAIGLEAALESLPG